MDDDVLIYRCNGCGSKVDGPSYCPHCKTPTCPECGRPNTVVCITEMRRMVSHSVENRSQQKKKTQSKPKRSKQGMAERIAELDALTR